MTIFYDDRFLIRPKGGFKNVIDRSMTIFCDNWFLIWPKGGFKIVIDQSMTIFCDNRFLIRAKEGFKIVKLIEKNFCSLCCCLLKGKLCWVLYFDLEKTKSGGQSRHLGVHPLIHEHFLANFEPPSSFEQAWAFQYPSLIIQ